MGLPNIYQHYPPDAAILDLLSQSQEQLKSLVLEASKLGLDNEPKKGIDDIQVRQKHISEQMDAMDQTQTTDLVNLDISRSDFSEPEMYWTYLLTNIVSKGYSVSYPNRVRKSEGDRLLFDTITYDFSFLRSIGSYSAEFILLAAQAVGQLFEWPDVMDLDRHLQAVRNHRK